MEKYIQQWINQEVQIIEHIKIQIIYQIRDRTTEEKELQKCKSRDKQRIQRKINRLKYINRALWRHHFELFSININNAIDRFLSLLEIFPLYLYHLPSTSLIIIDKWYNRFLSLFIP